MSIENKSINYHFLYDSASERALKYASLLGTALGTIAIAEALTDDEEVKKLLNEKYYEIKKEFNNV